jgi:hypothetical protein
VGEMHHALRAGSIFGSGQRGFWTPVAARVPQQPAPTYSELTGLSGSSFLVTPGRRWSLSKMPYQGCQPVIEPRTRESDKRTGRPTMGHLRLTPSRQDPPPPRKRLISRAGTRRNRGSRIALESQDWLHTDVRVLPVVSLVRPSGGRALVQQPTPSRDLPLIGASDRAGPGVLLGAFRKLGPR